MNSPRTVALMAQGGRPESLAAETLSVLASFGIEVERLCSDQTPDAARHAVAIVVGNRDEANRLARLFPGPVLLVPDGADPAAALASVRSAASEESGVPIGVLAVGVAGARNAALAAVAMLAVSDPDLLVRYRAFRDEQTARVLATTVG